MKYTPIEKINSNPIYAPIDYGDEFCHRIKMEINNEILNPNMEKIHKLFEKKNKIYYSTLIKEKGDWETKKIKSYFDKDFKKFWRTWKWSETHHRIQMSSKNRELGWGRNYVFGY